MKTIGKFFSSVAEAFDINPSTLSGCIDVVVVRQEDGSYKSTPFHVRFGKLKLLKCRDKSVKIKVNGLDTGLQMKLAEEGEGFFEEVRSVIEYEEAFNVDKDPEFTKYEVEGQDSKIEEESETMTISYNAEAFGIKTQKGLVNSALELPSDNVKPKVESETPLRVGMEIEGFTEENCRQKNKLEGLMLSSQGRSNTLSYLPNRSALEEGDDDPLVMAKNNLSSSKINNHNTKKLIVKSSRPSSAKLKGLNLRIGSNTITYTVNSDLQGPKTLSGHIYYWPNDANVIISDIDGTITKSDFLGHLMPIVGRDWSQPGIAPLYSNIRRHGYYILYLTARPIGQSQQTKDFLHSIYQDGKMLPHGPLITSPDRSMPSVKREIIDRTPQIFKMAVLKDIRSLFPEHHNPFHAGFGNRETDAVAYESVGIPLEKVFIVNPKGDIYHHGHVGTKSYSIINTMVKDMFPDILKPHKMKLAEKLDFENILDIKNESKMEENIEKVVN